MREGVQSVYRIGFDALSATTTSCACVASPRATSIRAPKRTCGAAWQTTDVDPTKWVVATTSCFSPRRENGILAADPQRERGGRHVIVPGWVSTSRPGCAAGSSNVSGVGQNFRYAPPRGVVTD